MNFMFYRFYLVEANIAISSNQNHEFFQKHKTNKDIWIRHFNETNLSTHHHFILTPIIPWTAIKVYLNV